jgi:hypothetical protein
LERPHICDMLYMTLLSKPKALQKVDYRQNKQIQITIIILRYSVNDNQCAQFKAFNHLTPFDYLKAKKNFGGQNGAEITSSQTYNSNAS